MCQPTVYLAGPIKGLDYSGATSWRDRVEEALRVLGITAFSPMRGKEFLRQTGVIDSVRHPMPPDPLVQQSGVVTRDMHDVTHCDALLVYLLGADLVSIGTVCEMAWSYMLRKPMVVVMETSGNPHEHLFIREFAAAFRTDDLEDAIRLLRCILLP